MFQFCIGNEFFIYICIFAQEKVIESRQAPADFRKLAKIEELKH